MANVWTVQGSTGEPENREPAERLADLARHTLEDARELVRAEIALARSELKGELKLAAVSMGVGAVALLLLHTALLVLVAALLVFLGGDPLTIAVVGVALVALAMAGVVTTALILSRRHLPRTRERFTTGAHSLLRYDQ